MRQKPRRLKQKGSLLLISILVGVGFNPKNHHTMMAEASTQETIAVQEQAHQYFATDLEPLFERTPPITPESIEAFFSEGRLVYESHFRYMVRVQVVGGQIFISQDSDLHPDVRHRLTRVVESLYDALTVYDLPDADFALQLGDGAPWELIPFMSKGDGRQIYVPFFAQDKPRSVDAILIPPRGSLDPDHSAVDWCFADSAITRASRIRRAVWRGSTTGGNYGADSWGQASRTKIVKLSRKRPDLLDASFVHIEPNTDVRKSMLTEGLSGPFMTTAEQREYAIILVVDGNTVPDRLASQLLSGPAIVRQESFHHEYWYDDLKPWVHYIPVRQDLSDLEEILEKALADEAMLANVSAAARSFVLDHLSPSSIRRYWNDVLIMYSRHMSGSVRPAHGSHLVNTANCLARNCPERNQRLSFGFEMPLDVRCDAPLESKMPAYRHRCSRWTGSFAAVDELSCMLYNVSITCTDCEFAGMCIPLYQQGVMGGCTGLCLQWMHPSSSHVDLIESITGVGTAFVVAPGSSSSSSICDATLSVPAIVIPSLNGFKSKLDRSSYFLYSLYAVIQEFGFGTDFRLLFADVGSVQELGSFAPLVLAMTDTEPIFLPNLINQKLCAGALAIGVADDVDKTAPHVSFLARGRNYFLSRMGLFVSNRMFERQRTGIKHSTSAGARAAPKHQIGFFGGLLLAGGVHTDIFFESLGYRGLDAVFLPDNAPVTEKLRAVRTVSCMVGATDSLVYMVFSPNVLGVVEVLSPMQDVPEYGRALAAQMGRKLVNVMLRRVSIERESLLILPSFNTDQAIRKILESDPWAPSEISVYREVLKQQLPCGNPPAPPCFIGKRKFVCTSLGPPFVLSFKGQPTPRQGCFGGDLSWGTCYDGKFLCDYWLWRSFTPLQTVEQNVCLNGVCTSDNGYDVHWIMQ